MATLVSVSQQAWDDLWDDDTDSSWVTAPKQLPQPGGQKLSLIYGLGQNLKKNKKKTVPQHNTDIQVL